MSDQKLNKKGFLVFAGGLALGAVGKELLKSDKVKETATKAVALGLRTKDNVMEQAEKVRAEGGDIIADARDLNDKRQEENKVSTDYNDGDM